MFTPFSHQVVGEDFTKPSSEKTQKKLPAQTFRTVCKNLHVCQIITVTTPICMNWKKVTRLSLRITQRYHRTSSDFSISIYKLRKYEELLCTNSQKSLYNIYYTCWQLNTHESRNGQREVGIIIQSISETIKRGAVVVTFKAPHQQHVSINWGTGVIKMKMKFVFNKFNKSNNS